MSGAFTEMAWWNSAITADTAITLYNDGKALDARECGDIPNLYWKNSGANDCKDLIGDANDLDVVTDDSDADFSAAGIKAIVRLNNSFNSPEGSIAAGTPSTTGV